MACERWMPISISCGNIARGARAFRLRVPSLRGKATPDNRINGLRELPGVSPRDSGTQFEKLWKMIQSLYQNGHW
jgi:hypothetical protein